MATRDALRAAERLGVPSLKLKGKKPRVANMIVSDYLRPAAVRAGVLKPQDPVRFGFHTFRHSLASFLVHSKTDVKTVQSLLRHADVKTTLQLYTHTIDEAKMAAEGAVLNAILQPAKNGGERQSRVDMGGRDSRDSR